MADDKAVLPVHEVERVPFHVVFADNATYTEVYGGGHGAIALQGQVLRPRDRPSDTVLVFMHPSGVMNLLPLPNSLAGAGVHCITCASRYPNNDSALIMEKVVVDLGQVSRFAKKKLGYRKVVLAGWSGGGSLSMFYQSQATHPTVTHTPAGEAFDLGKAGLQPADAMLQLAAHVSRATTLTEWMDPSIKDEADPFTTDPQLDLYHPEGPRPPYDETFLKHYRQAQQARNRRITAWVKQELSRLPAGTVERAFVVHGTMADPRWLDPAVDPNDRKPGTCYLGDPRAVNHGPAGLARFCTLRSWLSQWSLDDSNADGPRHAAHVTVPTLVVENSADDACTPSHTRRIFGALAAGDKQLHTVRGANHYYLFQPNEQRAATALVRDWLLQRELLP